MKRERKIFSGRSNPELAKKIAISADCQLGDISIKTFGKTLIQYNYDINFLRNYLNIDFKNVGKSELTIMAFPNEDLSLMLKHVFGKEIAYNEEIPEIGRENSIFFR